MALEESYYKFATRAVFGAGVSASSNHAVLTEAQRLYFQGRPPVSVAEVAREALARERHLARGLAIAADDVYPIAYGGAVKVITDGKDRDAVTVKPIRHDPRWIARHVVVAIDTSGERHDVPDLLQGLMTHRRARKYVVELSALAEHAARAISQQNARRLGGVVDQYRQKFQKWTRDRYVNDDVHIVAARMEKELKGTLLGWKPPGAGASNSVIVIAEDSAPVIEFFEKLREAEDTEPGKQRWWASPAFVTTGLLCEYLRPRGEVRFSAGHRIDFVGAADLGQDEHIRQGGICCSCAVEPRSEMTVHKGPPAAPQELP